MFTSGHMYNTIRHTPYMQGDGRGGFNYIAGGFQNQFGVETHIIAGLCMMFSLNKLIIDGLLAFTTMALVLKAPAIRDPTNQSIVIWIWTGGILIIYSFLIFIFRIKNGGYPFRLFL
jgi:oligosaccharyltransferase complex subunit gamma